MWACPHPSAAGHPCQRWPPLTYLKPDYDNSIEDGLTGADRGHVHVRYGSKADLVHNTLRNCAVYRYRKGMGVRNLLIEGFSGTGKTAVATELQRRGYQAIHGDRELAYQGDPETGLPIASPPVGATARWMSRHHIWDVEKVRAYVANRDEPITFFCGGSRNFSKFIDMFDGVLALEVDLDTINRRIDERLALDPTDYGRKPEERELIAELYETGESIPTNATRIDAAAPIPSVVDDILSRCGVVERNVVGAELRS